DTYIREAEQSLEEMRRRSDRQRGAGVSFFWKGLKQSPGARRLSKIFHIPRKHEYSATVILKADAGMGSRWQMKTAFF
ncbi:MAG: hypothetical protein ACOZBW_02425, partial [Thermodesulfobacteriota bacterium]